MAIDSANRLVLMGCGDVGPIHEPMHAYSTLARSILASADLRFGQVERVYSERGALQVHSGGGHSRCKPAAASVLSDCAFDVVSVASNHAMDWGPDALLDTIELLRAKGMHVVGAGRNLAEARASAIIERNGVRVAFLAFCSILHEGYAASASKPGIAPLRAHTYYQPVEYQAGVPPRVVTVPHEDDLEGMLAAIAAAKRSADVVVLSMHWGIHFIPRMVADYQTIAAKAAFDAGADLILGHHAHVPKAIGVYAGKVCFYSLSNFIMSSAERNKEDGERFERRYGVKLDPQYPRLPYGADAKRSLIAKAVLSREGVERVSFLPVLIDPQLRPEVLRSRDARFEDALGYMRWASEGFPCDMQVDGDEIRVQ